MPKKRQQKYIPDEQNEPEKFIEWLFDFIYERNYKTLRTHLTPRILSEYGIFEALCQVDNFDPEVYNLLIDSLKMCVRYSQEYDYTVVITEAIYALLKNKSVKFSYSTYYNKNYIFHLLLSFNFDVQQFVDDLNNNYFEEEMNNDTHFLNTLFYCMYNSMHRKFITFFKPANWKLTNVESVNIFLDEETFKQIPSSIFLKTNEITGRNFYDNCLIDLLISSTSFIHTKHAIPTIELNLNEYLTRVIESRNIDHIKDQLNNFQNFYFIDFETELFFYYIVKNNYLYKLRDNVNVIKTRNKNSMNTRELTQLQLYQGLQNYVNVVDSEIKRCKSELRVEFDKYCPIIIPDLQNIILRFLF
jgi:hypothetical protein